jgi:hypothetical protein
VKALTLTQPWATLVALGHKRIETRSWSTNYRGLLAIHAAKGFPATARAFAAEERAIGRLPARLPCGAIVATCELVDVRRTEEVALVAEAVERRLGDYTAGRYAWILSGVVAVPEPIPARGALGLWEWDEEPRARGEGP